jgi:hypothetical protein
MLLTVVFAVAAAFSNGVNVLTQHTASIGAPRRDKGWHLVGYLFRQPLWLLGWIAASPARVTIAVVSFAVMAAGVGMLSRTAPRDVTPSEPVPDEHARGRTGADRPRPG